MGKAEQELLGDILEELRFISRTLMHHFPTPPPAREPTPQDTGWPAPGTISIDARRNTVGSGARLEHGGGGNGGWAMMNTSSAQIYTLSGFEQPPEDGSAGVMAYVGGGGGGSDAGAAAVTIEDLVDGFSVSTDLAGLLRRLGQARSA